jgi:hypothetical protein
MADQSTQVSGQLFVSSDGTEAAKGRLSFCATDVSAAQVTPSGA